MCVCVCVCRAVLGTSSSSRVDGAAPPARLQSWGYKSTVQKNVVTNRDGVLYSTPLQKLLLAMARMRGDVGRAAAAAAAAAHALGLEVLEGFEVVPRAVQKMSRGVDGGVTATGVLSRERGNLITISITLY